MIFNLLFTYFILYFQTIYFKPNFVLSRTLCNKAAPLALVVLTTS